MKPVYEYDKGYKPHRSSARRKELLPLYRKLMALSKKIKKGDVLDFNDNGIYIKKNKNVGGAFIPPGDMDLKALQDRILYDASIGDTHHYETDDVGNDDEFVVKYEDDIQSDIKPYLTKAYNLNNDEVGETLNVGEELIDVGKIGYKAYKFFTDPKVESAVEAPVSAIDKLMTQASQGVVVGTALWDLSRGFKDTDGKFSILKMSKDLADVGVNFLAPELAPAWGLIYPLIDKAAKWSKSWRASSRLNTNDKMKDEL